MEVSTKPGAIHKLAADTFRAVKSESQVPQALALRDKALSMAAALDSFFQEDAA